MKKEFNPNEWLDSMQNSPSPNSFPGSPDDLSLEENLLPTLPDDLFDHLPDFFKRVVLMADSKEQRDILFLGSLVTLSSCLSSFTGRYGKKKVYPNLYLYVTAPASAGKGSLIQCRSLVDPVEEEKREEAHKEEVIYDHRMREFNAIKNKDLSCEKPPKPRIRVHFIPANNSSTGFYQILSDNDGSGMIFETEGDTISQAFKTDYGNFSDGLRRAFHHEPISYYRRTDREYVSIKLPRVSVVISSTMGQVASLIPSVENGMASRFMFYAMNIKPVWMDVFADNYEYGIDDHFKALGHEFYSLYRNLKQSEGIEFKLNEEQRQKFNAFFTQLQDKYLLLLGMDSIATVRRLGLTAFRIMMVLTAMRIPETGDFSSSQGCLEDDFQSALSIIKVLIRHASYVASQLPDETKTEKRPNKKEKFFEALALKFTRKDFIALARSLDIADRTADKYISAFCDKGLLLRPHMNDYMKKPDD